MTDLGDGPRGASWLRPSVPALGFEDMVNALPMPCLVVAADWRVRCFNPAAAKLLLAVTDNLLDKSVQELFAVKLPFDMQLGAGASEREAERITTARTAAGADLHILVRRTPMVRQVALWLLRDPDGLTEAQRALQRRSEELEQATRDVEQFVYGASHDLKEPLRVINGHLDLLAMEAGESLNEVARESMHYALDGVKRAQALVNGLLTYSRAGFQDEPHREVDAGQCLNEALTNLAARVKDSGAVITVDTLPTVKANANQLTMLFQNLVGNAIKFTRGRAPAIHVGFEYKTGVPCFRVRDNGIGLEPQHCERVFRMFERLHSDAEFEGTGIGLALCKRIVELHDGSIWVESEIGAGSTFHFSLGKRVERNEQGSVGSNETVRSDQSLAVSEPEPLTTVLVDDVPGIRHLVRIALERSGHFRVTGQASTGQEGIDVAREQKPDVVLLDLSMPGMDGLEALPRIVAASPDSRVVIYSGFEDARLGSTARALGARGYIEKGTEPEVLWRTLLDLVTQPSAPAN